MSEKWLPHRQELEMIANRERRRRVRKDATARAKRDPQVVDRLRGIRHAYPWLMPTVAAPLAISGHDKDSTTVQTVAGAAAAKALRTGRWALPGERQDATVVRQNRNGNRGDEAALVERFKAGSVGDFLGDAADTVGKAFGVVGQAQQAPNTVHAVQWKDPQQQGRVDALRQGFRDAAGSDVNVPGLKGVTRAAMLAFQVGNDAMSASIRNIAAGNVTPQVDDPTAYFTDPLKTPETSLAQFQSFQALNDLIEGRKVDTGSGWFPDPESRTGRAAAQAARDSGAPLINGSAFTAGRWVANGVGADSDSVAYNLISGGIDALIAVRLDPTNMAFNAYTDAMRTRKSISGVQSEADLQAALAHERVGVIGKQLTKAERQQAKAAKEAEDLAGFEPSNLGGDFAMEAPVPRLTAPSAEELLDLKARHAEALGDAEALTKAQYEEFGAFANGHRPVIKGKTATEALTSKKGVAMVEGTILESSPTKIWYAFQRKIPLKAASDLAEAGTENGLEARRLLGEAGAAREAGDIAKADDLTKQAGEVWSKAGDETRAVWRKYLGTDVKEMPTYRPPTVVNGQDQSRLAYILTERFPREAQIKIGDRDSTMRDVDDWLRNMKVPFETRVSVGDKIASYKSRTQAFDMVDAVHEAGAAALKQHGFTQEEADLMMTWAKTERDTHAIFNAADIADGRVRNPVATIDPDTGKIESSPMWEQEFFSRTLTLPDARAMRHATRDIPWFPSWEKSFARNEVLLKNIDKTRAEIKHLPEKYKEKPLWDKAEAAEKKRLTEQLADLQRKQKINDKYLAAGKIGSAGAAGVDKFMSYWRTYKLLRMAWGVRVVGEEMARLAAYGYTSINHPLDYMLVLAGAKPESRLGKLMDAFAHGDDAARNALKEHFGIDRPRGWVPRKYERDPTHAAFEDADTWVDAMNPRVTDNLTGRNIGTKRGDLFKRSAPDEWELARLPNKRGRQAWAEEFSRMRQSKIAQGILEQRTPVAAKEWFLHGEGQKWRVFLDDDPAYAGIAADDVLAGKVFDSMYDRIMYHTGEGNTALMDALRKGELNGVKLGKNEEVGDELAAFDHLFPKDGVRARRETGAAGDYALLGKADEAKKSKVLDSIMYQIMPRPSNYFSRSPLYRQQMWQREVPQLMEFADAKTQAAVLDAARSAGLTRTEIQALERIRPHVGEGTIKSAKELTELAHHRALSEVKDVLYDLSEKGQVFDLLRNIVPFGEAWREVLTRWARAVAVNPKVVHRLDQALESGREQGFFSKDGITGQEMFTIPGSKWLTESLVGVPIPLKGSLSGLNMIGQIAPGLGPVVTLPVGYFWESSIKPALEKAGAGKGASDAVYELLFPFGNDVTGNPVTDIAAEVMPTWGKWMAEGLSRVTGLRSPEDSRSYASAYQSIVDYLYSTGDYKLYGKDARDEMARLMDDAKSRTNKFMIVRGLAVGTLPTAPVPNYVVRDRRSDLQEMSVLKDEFYDNAFGNKEKGIKPVGQDAALKILLKKYGPSVLMASIPRSETQSIMPRTKGGTAFVSDRKWMRDLAPEVYGALVPESGKFDLSGYDQSFNMELGRTLMSARDRLRLANHRLGSLAYDQYFADAEPGDEDAKAYREQLKRSMPGFNDQGFDYEQTPRRIEELRELVNNSQTKSDPKLKKVAAATRAYLDARDEAIDAAPYSLKAKGSAAQREWLLDYAESLFRSVPSFRKVWDTVLRWEFPSEVLPAWATRRAA